VSPQDSSTGEGLTGLRGWFGRRDRLLIFALGLALGIAAGVALASEGATRIWIDPDSTGSATPADTTSLSAASEQSGPEDTHDGVLGDLPSEGAGLDGPEGTPSENANVEATVVNVRDHGASGDGKSNDRKSIQAALDSAGAGDTVYLPAGVYSVDRAPSEAWAIRVPSGITLRGEGGESVIRLAADQGEWVRVLTVATSEDVAIEQLTVDGNAQGQEVESEQRHGIFVDRSQHVTVRDVVVRYTTGDGIYFHGRSSGVVEGSRAYGGEGARVAFNFQGAEDAVFHGNYAEAYDVGYKAEVNENSPSVRKVRVVQNVSRETPNGIAINGHSSGSFVFDVVIEGNDFEFTSDDGFWIKDARGLVIRDNVFRRPSGGTGFYIRGNVQETVIESNVVPGAETAVAINEYVGFSRDLTIRNNRFPDAEVGLEVLVDGSVGSVVFTGNQLAPGARVVLNPGFVKPPLEIQGNWVG